MSRNYKQGRFYPLHPEKYVGKLVESDGRSAIIYRSSWEKKTFMFMDQNPNVTHWNSEGLVVKYILPSDGKVHRYFVDMLVNMKVGDQIKTYLIEIKPEAETKPPVLPKRKTSKSMRNYAAALETWDKNCAKWEAATEFAKERGWEFIKLTEKHIFNRTK